MIALVRGVPLAQGRLGDDVRVALGAFLVGGLQARGVDVAGAATLGWECFG